MNTDPSTATILVTIAAYRDPELLPTVRDLFAKAAHPERIGVAICWQYDPMKEGGFSFPPQASRIRVDNVSYLESSGVCWARYKTQQHYKNEDFVFQIDSHMRFPQNWDVLWLEEWHKCENPRAILSAPPARYTPPDVLEENPMPCINGVLPWDVNANVRGCGAVLAYAPPKPLNGAFISAGVLFMPGQVVRDVPYDPYLYFNEEEITHAARFYTHGWDIYNPSRALIYHYYNPGGNVTGRPMHWDNHSDYGRYILRSKSRFMHLFGIEKTSDPSALKDIEKYGFGKVRTVEQYEAYCGINFKKREVTERALRYQFIEGLSAYLPTVYVPSLDDPK